MFTGEYLSTLNDEELGKVFDWLQEEHDAFMSGDTDLDMNFIEDMDDPNDLDT